MLKHANVIPGPLNSLDVLFDRPTKFNRRWQYISLNRFFLTVNSMNRLKRFFFSVYFCSLLVFSLKLLHFFFSVSHPLPFLKGRLCGHALIATLAFMFWQIV